MKKKLLVGLATGLMMFGTTINAHATLIDSGVGYVSDSETGLEWLKVGATAGQSYSAAISGIYHTRDGYRGATFDEVRELMTNAGLPLGTSYYTEDRSKFSPVDYFSSLFALPTYWGWTGWSASGYFAPSTDPNRAGSLGLSHRTDWSPKYVSFNLTAAGSNISNSYSYAGTFLVRNSQPSNAPVPEPATMLLMGTGLAGLVVARRKK